MQGILFLHKSTFTDIFFYDPSDTINNIFYSASLYPKGSIPFVSRDGILTL